MEKIHFAIAPVQEFISMARRTSDFWAGSYLISYLSGHAMVEIQDKGGEIVIPYIEDDKLIEYIERGGKSPLVGSLPNRFTAKVDGKRPDEIAKSAENAVKKAWNDLADKVWNNYLSAVEKKGNKTKEIWDRQTEGYWQVTWAIGDEDNLLDQRKNWRTYDLPPSEPGDKCTVMGQWQELSGHIRSHDKETQDEFWELAGEQLPSHILKEKERLCAIALVKRMLPRTIDDFEEDVKHWPSTVYMAAIPWLKHVCTDNIEEGEEYAQKVLKISEGYSRKGVNKHITSLSKYDNDLVQLDANVLYKDTLKKDEFKQHEKMLTSELKKLQKNNVPSPFYAMLVMDGDKMGTMLQESEERKRGDISKVLTNFASSAVRMIDDHDGITIYSGGDDVMAILPITEALKCAQKISSEFTKCFETKGIHDASISACLMYAHYSLPLQPIIEESHKLLDEVAKKENGRNSIVVSAMKSSGRNFQWCTTWDHLYELYEGILKSPYLYDISNSYLYSMMTLLNRFSEKGSWNPGDKLVLSEEFSKDVLKRLLVAEMDGKNADDSGKKENVENLLNICYTKRNNSDDEHILLDGIKMFKFLSQYEVSK